ncbi:hypothetical protein OSB04_010247 [Centaurea solstitialis]|uniref:PGG domain-containing protein n=1 Tax=Centaurea solstitialis TaxID=347529 RepID=A0AA38TER6_9ASTR|nr:hypothetical protein OSB04_010247 [Centaurea solstitialis]
MSKYDYVIRDLPIYKAALLDDWDSVSQIFEQDPELMTKQITYLWETPLIIAVGTNRSHYFVRKLVDRIVAVGASDKLFLTSYAGNNPLHYAAKVGNTIDAKLLVEQNPDMTRVPNPDGNWPLKLAAWHGNKETLRYLLTVTRDLLPGEDGTSMYTGVDGGDLITLTIRAGFYDVALDIIKMHPNIVLEFDKDNQTALQVLATKPEIFPSGNRLGFLGSFIYSFAYGIPELIEECLLTYPGLIWYDVGDSSLFLEAIKHRQERVYNLVFQMSAHKVFVATRIDEEKKDNALHIAAKLAPAHRLNVVSGAALQMQRELQWFQEVENFIEPSCKEAKNYNGRTPRMIFTDAHKESLLEGQQWMKDTASSCTVVAALIVTMAFAAAFKVPGGNQDDGKPLVLDQTTFMLFIVSDSVALFSSSTSVLMFLGILTSRYAESDFLYALPKRMKIGLLSLFLSLVATMIAFSATIALVLRDKVTWIAAPLVIATSIPVCLYGLLQFPLLLHLFYSTYGPSLFRKQNNRRIY